MDFAIRKILVPTDFSESSEHAFRYAVAMALDNDAEILVLHVVEKFMDYSLLYSQHYSQHIYSISGGKQGCQYK